MTRHLDEERDVERALASLNLYQAGPFIVPGNSYDQIISQSVEQLTPSQESIRSELTRWHPLVKRNMRLHLAALFALWRATRRTRLSKQQTEQFRKRYLPYLRQYGHMPFVAWFKLLEGDRFREVDLRYYGDEAIEIGVSNGSTSKLHFEDRTFEFGTEYVASRLPNSVGPHKHKFASDLRRLPLADGSLKSVFLVHIFDDLSFPIQDATRELARSLTKSGKLIFSTASDLYGAHTSAQAVSHFIDTNDDDFRDYMSARCQGVQTPGEAELAEILSTSGMEMEHYSEFLPKKLAPYWDAGMTTEMGLARTIADVARAYPLVMALLEKVYVRIFAKAWRVAQIASQEGERGVHCFAIARKA
jgi:SAM-dependent methyltransferase